MMGIFYKTVFDISVFYTFAAFFFSFAIGHETNPVSYVVFLASAFLLAISGQVKYHEKLLAAISAVIPVITLFIENTTAGRLEVVLLWVYIIFMIKQENYFVYYYHFMEKFKGFVIVLILPVILICFHSESGIKAANVAIPYLLIFLAAGVMTLQTARQRTSEESRKQFEKFQIFQTLLFFAICILMTATNLMQTLFRQVIGPAVKSFIFFFSNTLFKMISDALKLVPEEDRHWFIDRKGFEEAKSMELGAETFVEGNAWAEMIAERMEPGREKDMTGAFICIGIILGVIVLVALISKASKKSSVAALDVEREDLPEEESKNHRRKHYIGSERLVRRQYREFMKKAESRENGLVQSDTTEEIKEKYNNKTAADKVSAEQITEIYRRIRYGEKKAGKADVSAMKSLLKKI